MDAPVIIAGAGPVGLASACALARHGIRTVVLEAREGPGTQSRALVVLPRTLEILRGWGLLERFLAAGDFRRNFPIWVVGESAPRVRLDLSEIGDLCAVPGALLLPQHHTEALLAARLAETGLSEIRWGHRVEDVVERDGEVIVRVGRAGRGGTLVRGRWLVGCDGARSTVRERLGLRLGGRTFGTRFLVADVRLLVDRDLPWPRVVPTRTGVVAAVRAGELWRVIATGQREAALRANVAALFGTDRFEPVWISLFRVHRRTSPRFRCGRVLLAGDAAHLDSPAGGQGMNAGIHDAHNLAWKLARALEGADEDVLAASYEIERRGAILRYVHRYTTRLTRMVLLPPPLRSLALFAVRRLLRNRVARHAWLSRAGMLTERYRSPILSGHGPLLGARAPDVTLRSEGKPVLLHDLAGPDALLLLFGVPDPDLRRAVADVPHLAVHTVGTEASAELANCLRARPGTAVLVRPDGHIGWRANGPSSSSLRAGVLRALGERG